MGSASVGARIGNLLREVAALRPSWTIDETARGLESRRHTGNLHLVARLAKRTIAEPPMNAAWRQDSDLRWGASDGPFRCRGPKNRMTLGPQITSGLCRFVGILPSTKISPQTYTRDGPLQGGQATRVTTDRGVVNAPAAVVSCSPELTRARGSLATTSACPPFGRVLGPMRHRPSALCCCDGPSPWIR